MSFSSLICGTGGWSGPLPGDPENTTVFTATPAFGGIDIEFTYPSTNAHALAYTILYRGTADNFLYAARHREFTGNFFHDRIETDSSIRYYYWIQHVTTNGTVLDVIGPASAIAKPTIENMLDMLSGRINEGMLATALRGELARIDTLEDGINQEAEYRLENDEAIAEAFTSLQATFDDTVALVVQEVNTRSAADSALANQISTVQSQLGSNLATVQQTMETNINTVAGKVTEIGARYTVQVGVNDLVGGFGIYNSGRTIEAGFDVNRFWVGSSQGNKRKPFIIEGGTTYIDDAAINKLTFNKLRDESGSFIVENGKVKADYITIANAMITNAHIANGAITNAKLGNASVNSAKIADGSITNAKIGNAAITTAKIGNAQIDRLKLGGNAATVSAAYNFGSVTKNIGTSRGWVTYANMQFNMPEAQHLVIFYQLGEFTTYSGYEWFRLLINGVQRITDRLAWQESVPNDYGWLNFRNDQYKKPSTFMFGGVSGNNSITLQIRGGIYQSYNWNLSDIRFFVLARHR